MEKGQSARKPEYLLAQLLNMWPFYEHIFTALHISSIYHTCVSGIYGWVLLHKTIIDPHHWFHARSVNHSVVESRGAAFWERDSIFVRLSPTERKGRKQVKHPDKRNFSIRHPKTFQGAENASHAVKDSQSNPGIRRSREA